MSTPTIFLVPLNNSFELKVIKLVERVKIGRQTNARTLPKESNGYFDSKVLSRQHAEIWSEDSKVFIRDVKSSNGTFLNNERLSPEGAESSSIELQSNHLLEFGIDIIGDDNKSVIHRKVSAKVLVANNDDELYQYQQQLQSQQPQPTVNIHKCFDKLEQEIKHSKDINNSLQNLSGDFNQINNSIHGHLPNNFQPKTSTNLDFNSIQLQFNKFNQQLLNQQKNYDHLLNQHSILRTQLDEREKVDEKLVDDDRRSTNTVRPQSPHPDDDLPSFKELVSQNAALATRLSTLSDELTSLHESNTLFNNQLNDFQRKFSLMDEWCSQFESSWSRERDDQNVRIQKLVDDFNQRRQNYKKNDKGFRFAGIISVLILGLAAWSVISRGNMGSK